MIGEAKRRVMPELEVRVPEDWGIRPVPVERRRLRPFDLAVLWGDLAVSLLVMVAGALLVPALGTKDALLAGKPVTEIESLYRGETEDFSKRRERFLLYRE